MTNGNRSGEKILTEPTATKGMTFRVYRPGNPTPDTYSSTGDLRVDVRGNSLVLYFHQNDGSQKIDTVYGPGEWVTVNVAPLVP